MPTYAASGIIYAKATLSNLAVALSASGGTDEQITDRIDPPSLETGKITASTASDIVTGIDVNFENDCKAGQYIFAYGAGATPVLVGKIDSVDGPLQITLTDNASSDADEAPYGVMNQLIKTNENILIRVPRIPLNSTQSYIPNWAEMRVKPNDQNQYNDPSTYTSMVQYSENGTPIVINNTPVNVPYIIEPYNKFIVYRGTANTLFCWPEVRDFPNYIFALFNPFGNNAQQNLNPSTMYKLFTTVQIPGLLISTNYNTNQLIAAGYKPNIPSGPVGDVATNTNTSNSTTTAA